MHDYLSGGTYIQCPLKRIVRLDNLHPGDSVYCITKSGDIEETKVKSVANLGKALMKCYGVIFKEYVTRSVVSVWCSCDKQFAAKKENSKDYDVVSISEGKPVAIFETAATEVESSAIAADRELTAYHIEIEHQDGLILLHNNLIASTNYAY